MDKEQLKNVLKSKNNRMFYIILIIGIVLLMFSDTLFEADNKKENQGIDSMQINTDCTDTAKDLENILSYVYGIEKVRVMITYESSEEKTLAYDVSTDISKHKDHETESLETKEEKDALMSSGEPYIVKKIYPKVRGVIVVASGADNAVIKQNIIDSVKVVLDIADHKICVLNYKK